MNAMNKWRFLIPVFFSFLLPGMGQLYNGQAVKAAGILVGLFLFFVINTTLWLHVTGPAQYPLFLTLVGLVVVLWAYAQIDTIVVARRPRGERRWYQRWHGFLPVFLAVTILLNVVANLVRESYVEPFANPTESMLPTVWVGDRFYVDKRKESLREWKRGDLILYRSPQNPSVTYLKRILGIAGDTVEKTKDGMKVNGIAASEPQPCEKSTLPDDFPSALCRLEKSGEREYFILAGTTPETMPKVTLPEGTIFVIGDNRPNTSYGPIPVTAAIGRPLKTWYATTWQRMGRALR